MQLAIDEEEAPRTGHDLHFLERLSRAEEDATELALRLYRDPPLVRSMLAVDADPSVTRLDPELCEPPPTPRWRRRGHDRDEPRFAIPLGPEPDACRVIVAANGHFVTCLGPGMTVANARAVPWEHAARCLAVADAAEALERNVREGSVKRLMLPVYEAGFRMTREQAMELGAAVPIVFRIHIEGACRAFRGFLRCGVGASRIRRPRADEPLHHLLWKFYHACAHQMIVTGFGGEGAFDAWCTAGEGGSDGLTALLIPLLEWDSAPLSLRATWLIGQCGARALPAIDRAMNTKHVRTLFGLTLALAAIGSRHPGLREQVRPRLASLIPRSLERAGDRSVGAQLGSLLPVLLRGAESMDDADRDGFRAWAGEWVRDRPEIPRQPDGRPSLDFARRVLVDLEAPLLDAAHLVAILQWLPFVAAMRPEEFFHPASEASLLEGRYDVAQAQRLAACFRAGEPVRAVPTPGRNERCPCGSGRKYKKCCLGRPATAQGAPA